MSEPVASPPQLNSPISSPLTTVHADQSVESQTEAHRVRGTIWNAIVDANLTEVQRHVSRDRSLLLSRGPVGETPLHLACLLNSPAHLSIVRYILQVNPALIRDEYQGSEYQGENCLHIAVVNHQLPLVRTLLQQCPDLLRGRATGNFFAPPQPCYYGEYPLFFAACGNQPALFDLLLQHGAELTAVDSFGNTILHLMVIHGLSGMYTFICEHPLFIKLNAERPGALESTPNQEGLTPLTLAAKLGNTDMFTFLLERRRTVQWTYGPVSCMLLPLDEFDTRIDKRDHVRGALELIVAEEQLDLLMLPRVVELLRKKWNRFAERHFKQRLYFTLVFLFVLSVTTILPHPSHHESMRVKEKVQYFSVISLRIAGEAFVVISTLLKAFLEIRELTSVGVRSYFTLSGSGFLENVLSFFFCLFMFLVFFLRSISSSYEDAALSVAVVIAWSYLGFFFLGFRKTGPFVVMIYKMMIADMFRFGIIWIAFLLGFSQAFYVIFEEKGFVAYLTRAKECFVAMLGGFEFDDYLNSRYPVLSISLLVIYIFVVTILMFNLLIAMMSDTFSRINEEANQRWHLEWARIIISIENEMSLSQRLQAKYWVDVEGRRYLQVQEVHEVSNTQDPPADNSRALLDELDRLRAELAELRENRRVQSPPTHQRAREAGQSALQPFYEAPSPSQFPTERPITRSMTRRRHTQHLSLSR
mmetsp:Transcript_6305/g.19137  ORF Transcript_6305/g.19137 Transcript_6305/m.19137 type:complete len:700 (-) Transcript_6305:222-2321(-)